MRKRKVEIFTAGCGLCDDTVALVERLACPSCEVVTVNVSKSPEALERAKSYGVTTVPAVAVDGKLADCCASRGPTEEGLRSAGIGEPLL